MKNNKMMYQELAQDKIEPLKAALGAKTSKALVYFITSISYFINYLLYLKSKRYSKKINTTYIYTKNKTEVKK